MIRVVYTSIDGCRMARSYKTISGARAWAHRMVGPHPEQGLTYAVCPDGIGKVTVTGASLGALFPEPLSIRDRSGPTECRACGGDGYTAEATSSPMREATTECRACQGTGRGAA